MRENYSSIQCLRALAAILVILHHSRNPHPWLYNPLENFNGFARGVDIFFVISGFIMAAIASKEPPVVFAKKRIIRVAPIYWLATIVATLLIARKTGLNADLLQRFALSILFVPHKDQFGEAFPILPPGWTLNYEIFFYAIFFLCLRTSKPIIICNGTIFSLVALGHFVEPTSTIGKTYTSPLLLEFSCGLIIGHYRAAIISRPAFIVLAPIGAIILFCSSHWGMSLAGAVLIVTGALASEAVVRQPEILKKLGDASYFTYLSHHFVVGVGFKVWERVPLDGPIQLASLTATCLIVSSLIGLIGHRLVEKPMTRWLNRRFSTGNKKRYLNAAATHQRPS